MRTFVESLNPNAESLHGLLRGGQAARAGVRGDDRGDPRAACARASTVCAAFYGHPGVFVTPSHEAVRRAREEGFPARMLPGISAEDCLFADLGVDPSRHGCQSYEATEFLIYSRRLDPTAALVLWQIGTVGRDVAANETQASGLPVLVERLLADYPATHEVTVYEAAPYPGFEPLIRTVPLSELSEARRHAALDALRPAARPGRRPHDARSPRSSEAWVAATPARASAVAGALDRDLWPLRSNSSSAVAAQDAASASSPAISSTSAGRAASRRGARARR